MHVLRDSLDLTAWGGGAFVPTMGALHDGHAALVRRAGTLGAPVVVSIFVNPTQFGPGEDFAAYPRPLESDLAAAEAAGADAVFAPTVEVVYPRDAPVPAPLLPPAAAGPGLEDACRPGHFGGVCQVVARLFDLLRPAVAVFGEKDYQQLLVVRQMAAAHAGRWPGLRVEAHPTVRDRDGLALSSRNAYLHAGQRQRALGLSQALRAGRDAFLRDRDAGEAERRMRGVLEGHGLVIDYAVVRDARTLEALRAQGAPARGLIAARLERVRLIDNMAMDAAGPVEQGLPASRATMTPGTRAGPGATP